MIVLYHFLDYNLLCSSLHKSFSRNTLSIWRSKLVTQKGSSYLTYPEIKTQYIAWDEAISIAGQNRHAIKTFFGEPFDQVIFTGCGSTYYLSIAAASIFQQITGILSSGVPASELIFYPKSVYRPNTNTLLIAISRSAETTETVTAVKKFQKTQTGKVITITNYDGKPLTKIGDLNYVIRKGQEKSIAQTRAFTSMYTFVVALATIVGNQDKLFDKMSLLPEAGKELMDKYESVARMIGEDLSIDRFYFLGSGPRYGLACEGNLKMKEMTLTHSEPFHFYEFRHGPMSMVTASTVIPAFLSKSNRKNEESVLLDMQKLGARVLTIAPASADVILPKSLPEEIINVLYLPIVQLTAYYRSLAKNLDPDRPANLSKAVKIDNFNI